MTHPQQLPPDRLPPLRRALERVIEPAKSLPQQAFRPGYGAFAFLEFAEMSSPEFWFFLRRLGGWSGDRTVTTFCLDPPQEEFLSTFGRLGAVEAALTSRFREYCTALRDPEAARPRFDLVAGMLRGAWFPPSLKWAAVGERTLSTIVFGFSGGPPPFSEFASDCGLKSHSLDEMLEIAKLDFGIYPHKLTSAAALSAWQSYCLQLRGNYGGARSPGHPGGQPA